MNIVCLLIGHKYVYRNLDRELPSHRTKLNTRCRRCGFPNYDWQVASDTGLCRECEHSRCVRCGKFKEQLSAIRLDGVSWTIHKKTTVSQKQKGETQPIALRKEEKK